ncbi:hypothetical protein ACIA8O_34260 [Kitasatospora sp. NPDC051853]|uniref:hypothetical protein n=1 Tax=Kitasatospora sp. NPDC051853 TaxID=3364058 RepID=UPI0037AAC60B
MTTDIWAWVHDSHARLVEAGHHRLATALAEIAGHAVEGRNEQLDAVFPEALASARALGLPWVEVFLRHWRLQNLLNKRHQGEAALAEAVSLLEYAHRPETEGCPQAVCAVQDFTICHANIDGPGYVAERLAVLDEALARVEPARACFDCLSREYADTLEDGGRPEEALAHLDRAQARILAAGEQASLAFGHGRASALHRLGRHQEALEAYRVAELAQVAARRRLDEDDRRKLAVGRALEYAALGRREEALAQLPDLEEAEAYADIRLRWATAVELLAGAGAYPNDTELGVRLAHWVGYLDAAGSHRPCLDLLLTAGRLAVARGAREVARTLAATGERKLAQLRSPAGVSRQVAALRAAAEALPGAGLPVPIGELKRWMADHPGQVPAERAADLLAAAHAADPKGGHLPALAGALGALGHARAAAALLWEQLELSPQDVLSARQLAATLIEAGDGEGIRRLADRLAADSPAEAQWVRARWAAAEGRWAEVAERCAAVLAEDPSRPAPRRLGAAAATRLGDYPTAQRLYQELLVLPDGADDPHPEVWPADLWHLVTVATVNRDWAVVRAAGAQLGLEFERDEGPVDEDWQLVTVRAQRSDGTLAELPAVRTGPATARILPVLGEDLTLNHNDVVVFGPAVRNPGPDAGGTSWRPAFDLLALLDPAGYTTWWLDGAWPGAAAWTALRDALEAAGYGIWAHNGEGYLITDPDAPGGTLPGVYAALGVPPLATAAEADAVLTTLTAHWPHPLSWPELATAAGADPGPHLDTVRRYGL